MKNFNLALLNAAAITFLAGACAVYYAPTADAQRVKAGSSEQSLPLQTRQFSPEAGALFSQAQEFIRQNDFDAAMSALDQALSIASLTQYETSVILQLRGRLYFDQNKLSDAITAWKSAVDAGGLAPNEISDLQVNIARLLIKNQNHTEGATMLEEHINAGHPVKPAYVDMLVSAWVQVENYPRALPWAERWFKDAAPKERKHFDLLNFLYYNLGMREKQADIVVQMVGLYPDDRNLWDSWASLLANSGQEAEAFEVNKLLYIGGFMKSEQDVMKIVQYYSFHDMPYQAAKILEREMNAGLVPRKPDRLIMSSDLYRQARDHKRAIPLLESAASSDGSARVYAQLGEALYHDGQCGKSETAFRKAIDAGYDRGKAWSLIATCLYESSQQEKRISCEWSEAERARAPRKVLRDKAYAAFGNVPANTSGAPFAAKWQSFIKAEEQAVNNRCDFAINMRQETCFKDIDLANKSKFITGEFNLKDETCGTYLDAYNEIYK